MRLSPAVVLSWVLLLASPAAAASSAPPASPTVLMSPVAMPVIVDGQVVNYIFVTIRLSLSPKADSLKTRGLEPYFRDALVRAAHRTPFVRTDSYIKLDDDRLKASLLRDANAIAGPGAILSVQIIREQAQHYDGLPKPPTASR